MTEARLGIVIIGRNEGDRLMRCLASVSGFGGRVVYVDSGSTDRSVGAAYAAGAEVVELDMTQPFTAARARNAGLAALGISGDGAAPDAPEFVQFIDGDCEIRAGWLEAATAFLETHTEVGVVSGRLRERYPDASPYNALCDVEWQGPAGQVEACGGIAMMRSTALADGALFNGAMIAGEEPELCLRLRRAGWLIWRIADEMAWHDADLQHLGQFWTRIRRGGVAYGLWRDMYGADADRPGRASLRRALIWAAGLPALIVLGLLLAGPGALWLAGLYPLQIARAAWRQGGSLPALRTAALQMLAKFAEAQGFAQFLLRKWQGRPLGLIEHK